MNSRQFLVLFASVAVLKIVDCTFGESGALVVSGLGVHLPLASATAGTLGFPLAVLGVLKLAAAVELATLYQASQLAAELPAEEASAYGRAYRRPSPIQRYRYKFLSQKRQKRSAESSEAVFALVSSMDMYSCGKALVCGLEAKEPETLSQDEALIMALFADRKNNKHYVNPGSAKAEYELAAELGLATKDQVACRKRYSTCPYTADEMMTALRQSQL